MRMVLAGLLVPAALLCSAAQVRAATGDPIGSSVVVVNRVTALVAQDHRTLHSGDDVRQDELIEVANDGRSELKLRDETKLALGPGSRLLLDKFVYDPDQPPGSIAINLVKGAFRFVTGLAAKPSYIVRVPNASITVRGTIFDAFVAPDNSAWLLLHEGSVRVCNTAGQCRILDEPGKLIRISNGVVGAPERWTALPGRQTIAFDSAFPFLSRAPAFDPTPIFTRDVIFFGRIPTRLQPPPPHYPPTRRAGDGVPPSGMKGPIVMKKVHPRVVSKGPVHVGRAAKSPVYRYVRRGKR